MDPRLQRKRDLISQLKEDYDLLKQLEDALRYEVEPIPRAKLRKQIQNLNTQIATHQSDLEFLTIQLRGTSVGLADEVQDYLDLAGWKVLPNWIVTSEGDVEFLVERLEGLLFQRVLVCCVTDEADYPTLQRLRLRMSEQNIPIGWIIAESRVDLTTRKQVSNDPTVRILSLDEFFVQLFPLNSYFTWLREEYQLKHIDNYYVDLSCIKPTFDQEDREIGYTNYDPIDDYIDRWLDDRGKNHISILGDFGTGKTWFCWHYAYKQMERYLKRPTRERIPLLVPLRDYTKTIGVEQLFSDFFFRRHKINVANYSIFETLNRRGKFIILFDGFDEMARRVDSQTVVNNFWALAEVVVPNSKVILTCRTHYFRSGQEARNLLHNVGTQPRIDRIDRPRFEVLYLEEFDTNRIRTALTLRVGKAELSRTEKRIREVRNLLNLSKKPIMIEFILQALPELSPEMPVNSALIYRIVTDKWLNKNVIEERTILDKWDKMSFAMELAWSMLGNPEKIHLKIHYTELPDYIGNHLNQRIGEWTKLEHLDYDLRTQSFLVSDSVGNYEFAHRSLAEYFVALKFAIELGSVNSLYLEDIPNNSQPQAKSDKQLLDTFGRNSLSREVADFLQYMLIETVRLSALIDMTKGKSIDEARYLGSNAATILNLMGESFEEKDLSYTILMNADLSFANLRRANLSGANLVGANLDNAVLDYATCVDTDFTNVDLEEWGGASAIVFHPRGDNVVVAIFDATLKFWEVGDAWRQLAVTRHLPHAPMSIDYNSEGILLACGHWDGSLMVWNRETGQKLVQIQTGSSLYCVAFSPDSKYLATSDRMGIIRIWDTTTWNELYSIDLHNGAVYCVRFSPDSQYLASSSADKTIKLFTVPTWQWVKTLMHQGHVRSLCYSADGSQIASGGTDRKITLWDTITGRVLRVFEGHIDEIVSIDWAPDGERLASGGLDNTVIIWNAKTGEQEKFLGIHTNTVFAVRFSPDSKYLISGGDDWTIRVWDRAGNPVHALSQASWKGVDLASAKGFEASKRAWLRTRISPGWETDLPEPADIVEMVSDQRGNLRLEENEQASPNLLNHSSLKKKKKSSLERERESLLIIVNDKNFHQIVLDCTVPVLVEFSTNWCGPSRLLRPILEEIALEYNGLAVIVKSDIDEDPHTSSSYNIEGIPSIILFVKGQEIYRHVGWVPRWTLENELNTVLDKPSRRPKKEAQGHTIKNTRKSHKKSH